MPKAAYFLYHFVFTPQITVMVLFNMDFYFLHSCFGGCSHHLIAYKSFYIVEIFYQFSYSVKLMQMYLIYHEHLKGLKKFSFKILL